MLRTNSVPWHVSPARPAVLTLVANVWAGVQDLTLKYLTLSDEVDDIHCVFCLAKDEDLANESVSLRCFGTSCCVCRNEGPLDALIRPLRVQSSDARHIISTRNSSPNDPGQSQPRQRSVGPQGRSQWDPKGDQSSRVWRMVPVARLG
ncbi:hypothetical protein PCH_Pc17g00560 [Penicillium rubens Wisconsin 54-1255]|uniref:Uncharacterized protein n=1 Tax=Penicillium rubens (strain ATCC 28089 / DSM 1075 / NRRL 1951 / Wisconsin 54-1255) TaxID=500485 RepID=B6HAY3_PENRW|nr:hypothetical protein PCH_Pc17g00560 [Penicillium rubens Wisconsin 54-1255]